MGTRFQSTMAFDGVRLIQCTRLRTLVIIAAVTAAAIEDDAFQWHKDTWACSSTTPGRGDGCLGETGSAPGGIKKKAPPPAPGISSTLSTDRVQDQTHTINDRKDHTQIKDGTNQASNAAELIGDALRESAKQSSTRRKKSKGSRRRRRPAKQRKKSKCKSKPEHRRRHWRCTPQRECKVRFYYDIRYGARSITTAGAC